MWHTWDCKTKRKRKKHKEECIYYILSDIFIHIFLLYIQYIFFFYRSFFFFTFYTLMYSNVTIIIAFFLFRESRRNFRRHYHRAEIFALSASVPFAMNNRKSSDKTNFHCDVLYDNTSRDNLSRARNSYHWLHSSFLFSSRVFRRININEAKLFYKVRDGSEN